MNPIAALLATAISGLDILGYIAATLTTGAFFPQALKTIRTRDTSGISLGMYAIFTLGVSLWLIYGIVAGAWPIILANTITTPLAAVVLALKVKHG